MTDENPEWSDSFGRKLLGSVVLVGITRRTSEGDTREQFYGTVERADANGVDMALGGSRSGENFFFPPDPRNFFAAQPGTCRLRATGESIENPDFTTTWTIGPDED